VLSLATQYEDMESITRAYGEICDYRLVFTKADEAERLGSILNICRITGKRVAYITNGQSVPDDIKVISPDAAAKSLLGLGEV
jgi:flagellar biosynthesis protein FlhF